MPPELKSAKKNGRYDGVDLVFFTPIAMFFDFVVSWIPFLGYLGQGTFELIFYLKKVDTKGMVVKAIRFGSGLTKMIPFVSVTPTITVFVIAVFFANNKEIAGEVDKVVSVAGKATPPQVQLAIRAVQVAAEIDRKKQEGQSTTSAATDAVRDNIGGAATQPGGARTLPDGSQPAGGSPIAGGEEAATGPTTARPSQRELETGALEPQIDTANKPKETEEQRRDSGPTAEGGRYPSKKSPLETERETDTL